MKLNSKEAALIKDLMDHPLWCGGELELAYEGGYLDSRLIARKANQAVQVCDDDTSRMKSWRKIFIKHGFPINE